MAIDNNMRFLVVFFRPYVELRPCQDTHDVLETVDTLVVMRLVKRIIEQHCESLMNATDTELEFQVLDGLIRAIRLQICASRLGVPELNLQIAGLRRFAPIARTLWMFFFCESFCANRSVAPIELRGEQRAPENATHPKTQIIEVSEHLRFRCVVFSGALLFCPKRAPKHTGKRNTPEISDAGKGRLPAFSGVLRFRVCFGSCEDSRCESPDHPSFRSRRLILANSTGCSMRLRNTATRPTRPWEVWGTTSRDWAWRGRTYAASVKDQRVVRVSSQWRSKVNIINWHDN